MVLRKRHLTLTAVFVVIFLAGFTSAIHMRGIFSAAGRVVLGILNVNFQESGAQSIIVHNKTVDKFISLYQKDGRAFFSKALSRSTRYVPVIQKIFAKYNIPCEIAYLALIESGFNSLALSSAYAHGMWQFMAATGLGYGLRINYWVDERRDFIRATHAAAKFLRDLHNKFKDWHLALAAYNSGAGYIDMKLRQTGARDFWELAEKGNLYRETKEYVPRFIAATIIARNPKQYSFNGIGYKIPVFVKKVKVKSGASFASIARKYKISVKKLQELNLHIKHARVPYAAGGYVIVIPVTAGNYTMLMAVKKQKG